MRLRELTGLEGDAAPAAVALAVHRRLAEAPSVVIAATLEDALEVAERPNLPGTTADRRANWSLALPMPLEEIQADPRPRALAGILGRRVAPGGGQAEPR
jgi:4-alpha-glucanotransferase